MGECATAAGRTPVAEFGLNSDVTRVAWGITAALAIAQDVPVSPAAPLLQWALFMALLSAAILPFVWKRAQALRTYAGMLVLLVLLAAFFWNRLPGWMARQSWFPDPAGYAAAFLTQTPKLAAAFVMMAGLKLRGFRRQEYFLCGRVHRNVWIGSAVVVALILGLTMLVYLRPAGWAAGATRYLLLALVLAAMNSFSEEMLYRGVLLGPLLRHVPATQAIAMTAVLFGIGHYHGTPSGFPGMALTFVAGWIFGRAMVETRSILLPWFLHFVPDAVIFVSSALSQ